jgi:hypothetical protein
MRTIIAAILVLFTSLAYSQRDGLLTGPDGRRVFPIGFYELPSDPAALKLMAESGVNLVRCHSRADLDRASSAGLLGWLPLNVQQGATDELRKAIDAVKDSPALAAWEGPDEIVWNFTAAGELVKAGAHKTGGEWWRQTPEAVAYAEKQANALFPPMREGIALVRKLDSRNRPFWINEALSSDLSYVRRYMDWIDVTGCDLYPVRSDSRPVARLGEATDRWKMAGRGKPVWMVLQAFSWSELGERFGAKEVAYPTFNESRLMAYDAIVHGARGILYWGSNYLKSQPFRESLYALTSELAALEPFLQSADVEGVSVRLVEMSDGKPLKGVRAVARQVGDDWLVILVNEDDQWHLGVELAGLKGLDGRTLDLLYGSESAAIDHGELLTRLPPLGVKVFAAGRKWEPKRLAGREFVK